LDTKATTAFFALSTWMTGLILKLPHWSDKQVVNVDMFTVFRR
jgi:hypothetical protein